MRIAILADIHAHYAALERVGDDVDAWRPDAVAVAGDIVNRGPRPRECLDYVLDRVRRDGWYAIRGNHERYVLHVAHDPSTRSGLDGDVRESVRWTLARLGGAGAIAALPERAELEGPDGSEVRVVHASMRHDRDNMLATAEESELREKIAPPPDVFCCGHTHRAFVRRVGRSLVVNAGSVGLPFDGDRRAGYARLTWSGGRWEAELVRLDYDYERARRDVRETGLLGQGGAGVIIDAELADARPYMARWVEEYDERVQKGYLGAAESARRYVAERRAERQAGGGGG